MRIRQRCACTYSNLTASLGNTAGFTLQCPIYFSSSSSSSATVKIIIIEFWGGFIHEVILECQYYVKPVKSLHFPLVLMFVFASVEAKLNTKRNNNRHSLITKVQAITEKHQHDRIKHLVLTLHVSEKKDGEVCSDDTNVCFTYLKFDTLPTDADMFFFCVFFFFLFNCVKHCLYVVHNRRG